MINAKPKLALLSAFYSPYMSGAEQMVKVIAERMGDRYDITLITGRYDRANPKTEDRPSFKLVRVGVGHKQIDKLLYPVLAAWRAKRIRPAIAHAVMESYAGAALIVLKYIDKRIKRMLTLQSGDLDDPLKQKKFMIRLFWRGIHLAPHRVTAISSFLAKRAEKLGVAPDRISITPNGVDLEKIPGDKPKISGRVAFVGRISWEKGVNYLVDAWPAVKKAVPAAELAIIGPEDKREQDIARTVHDKINEYGIAGSVKLTGALPHGQALAEVARAEAFVCPSLAEGLGLVFVEAQACGTPPVGARVGGIPDVIQDGENGLLVPPRDPQAISEALIRLLTDKELNKRLAEKGRETARNFDWNIILKKIDKIYQELTSTAL